MILKIAKNLAAGAALLSVIFTTWFMLEIYVPPGRSEGHVVVNVEKGKSVTGIAFLLKDKKVIRKKWPFLFGYRIFYGGKPLKAGEYQFHLPVSVKEVLKQIVEGRINLYPVTIQEGLTRREVASHLNNIIGIDEEEFLFFSQSVRLISRLDSLAENLEGYLFPETYHFPKDITARDVVKTMVQEFLRTYRAEWEEKASQLGMSVREIVILASLIEKETGRGDERKLISAVFHNRLRIGMKLDCDPTIIYALKEEERFDGNLRKRDLRWDSPFNTYIYAGLPPCPIANPGKESLKAALYPDDQDYLYFVSRNDGSHHFSSTFREHQKAVDFYQKKRGEGPSPFGH